MDSARSLTLVPVEATVQTALRRAHLPALRDAGPVARLIAEQATAFEYGNAQRFGNYESIPRDLINFQHDPLAVAVALGWDGVGIEDLYVSSTLGEEGRWLRQREEKRGRPARVVTAVDRDRFEKLWLGIITGAGGA